MQAYFSRHAWCCIAFTACALLSAATPAHGAANAAQRPAAAAEARDRSEDRNPAPLSAEQVAKVKAVLAAYKPATLKADDAKAIKRALRDAGLRHNAALDKAITDAGFSPQRLEELDPRPAHPPGSLGPPGAQGGGSATPPAPPRSAETQARRP